MKTLTIATTMQLVNFNEEKMSFRKKKEEKKEWSVMIPITAIIRFFDKKVKKTEPKDAVDEALKEYERKYGGKDDSKIS